MSTHRSNLMPLADAVQEKPRTTATNDPWEHVRRAQSSAKKEELPETSLPSNSTMDSSSPMLRGVKRARSDSPISSLPSDMGLDSSKHIIGHDSAKRPQRASLACPLLPVYFEGVRNPQHKRARTSSNKAKWRPLSAVTFEPDQNKDVGMAIAYVTFVTLDSVRC